MEKKNRKPNQCERVVKYIRDFGSISTWQAMMDLGVARLASRIYDLKQQGYEFEKKRIWTVNRYGGKTYYDEYRLIGDKT